MLLTLIDFKVALNAQLLKPRMTCLPSFPPYSHRRFVFFNKTIIQLVSKLSTKVYFDFSRCMEMVASKRADVTMLEAGDVYRAGKGYGLIPIMSEVL